MIDNETLGYFIARIYLFLTKIGINPARLRFRQHMANEMAHYAADCWDAEIDSSYGWIECVGCADRSAYDLTVHSKKTDTKMVVRQQLKEVRVVERWVATVEKKAFGPKFKKDARALEDTIMGLDEKALEALSVELQDKQCVLCCQTGAPRLTPVHLQSLQDHLERCRVRGSVRRSLDQAVHLPRVRYAFHPPRQSPQR